MKHVFFVLISMVVFNSGAALALTAEEVETKLSELDLGLPVESVSQLQTRLRRQLLYLLISTADSVENSTRRCQL